MVRSARLFSPSLLLVYNYEHSKPDWYLKKNNKTNLILAELLNMTVWMELYQMTAGNSSYSLHYIT